MGLDMYLTGQKYNWHNWTNPETERKEDGFRVAKVELDLGYWRKHPNLHGYIVEKFGGGNDNCQIIDLNAAALRTIIGAIKEKKLPHTSGFFFGTSDTSVAQVEYDVKVFEAALAWLENAPSKQEPTVREVGGVEGVMSLHEVKVPEIPITETRSVHYQASW